jgi:hypothetical protein
MASGLLLNLAFLAHSTYSVLMASTHSSSVLLLCSCAGIIPITNCLQHQTHTTHTQL